MDLEKLEQANYLTKLIPRLKRRIKVINNDNFWVAYRDNECSSNESFTISKKLRAKLMQLVKDELVSELEKAEKELTSI